MKNARSFGSAPSDATRIKGQHFAGLKWGQRQGDGSRWARVGTLHLAGLGSSSR